MVAQLGATSDGIANDDWRPHTKCRSDSDLKAACAIRINKQSPDIAGGVNVGNGDLDVGAGDQDITLGYSSDETEDVIHSMSTRLERN